MPDIGKRIKEKRELLGMTQEELAQKLGYRNKSSIAKIETGTNDIVQSKVVEFAKVLNTTVAFLMGWDEPNIMEKYQNASPKIEVLVEIANNIPSSQLDRLLSYAQYLKSEKDND